jgi:hypothetical protein
MEIVKIRMQMQKKQEGGPRLGALGIARELGIRGLYTGGKATLLRFTSLLLLLFSSSSSSSSSSHTICLILGAAFIEIFIYII